MRLNEKLAGRAWIARRLAMGDESRITKLVRAVDQDKRFAELKGKQKIPKFTD
jgi:hypothetical protein